MMPTCTPPFIPPCKHTLPVGTSAFPTTITVSFPGYFCTLCELDRVKGELEELRRNRDMIQADANAQLLKYREETGRMRSVYKAALWFYDRELAESAEVWIALDELRDAVSAAWAAEDK